MPKEGAVFLIPAKPDLQHLLAPFAALFLLDNARSGHNGCGRASVKNASSNISVEEILNSCTHGIGLVLSIAGFMVFCWRSPSGAEPLGISSVARFMEALSFAFIWRRPSTTVSPYRD
jgi:hypothetical protein